MPFHLFYSLIALVCLSASVYAANLERGRTIYSQICFNCHGPKLEGGQGPALKDQYWQHGSSPEAILNVINKGVPGSPMIAFETVFPESDRLALRDFILSEQEGLREVVRSVYPRQFFKNKRFTPALFEGVESDSQTPLPENWYYMDRNADGVMRGTAKLYIREEGDYEFAIRPIGRTSIFLNGDEVHYSDESQDKSTHFNKAFHLDPGVHDLQIFHEEKIANSYRFHGVLKGTESKQFALNGRSLEGNIPKIITARPGEAQVIRKWIEGLPPRALLCLLPNQVIVAYNPENGSVLKAWHTAEINQTPSLPDRSQKPSEIKGTLIPDAGPDTGLPDTQRFLRYEVRGDTVRIASLINGGEKTVTISPHGTQSYTLSVQ